MEGFNRHMGDMQTEWRRQNIASQEHGTQNGKRRPWILPKALWEEGLWPGIRSDSPLPLASYLDTYNIKKDEASWQHMADPQCG